MKTAMLLIWLALATRSFGQNAIPTGTILPLRLNASLNSANSKPGQAVSARLMQDVPLPSGAKIRAGSIAIGQVLAVAKATDRSGAEVSFRFDTLKFSKRRLPVTTNLRALASMAEVDQAQLPKAGADRGTSENTWTTVQIGGDVVYRGGGPVANGLTVVGVPVPDGVLAPITSGAGTKCRGDFSGDNRPQALWVFSADACGIYGFPDLTIQHAGRSDPVGQITVASEKKNFSLRRGTGFLLRVQ
jgi:hypothetical protein